MNRFARARQALKAAHLAGVRVYIGLDGELRAAASQQPPQDMINQLLFYRPELEQIVAESSPIVEATVQ